MKMKHGLILLAALLAGCAGYGAALVPGQSTIENVKAAMGEPTMVRELPDGDEILWYSKLPFGRESYAARIDPDGLLISLEQRLSREFIAQVRPNQSTADDVLNTLGPPYRVYQYPRQQREAWEYQLRTPPDMKTLYVQLSPDRVVREVFELHDRDMRPGFFFLP
jgi:hypothetical protein